MSSLQVSLTICISVMALLFGSFLYALIATQKKKLKHQQDLQLLREEQQNQLIEAAIRSEEIERHRIAEELHDEVGAILSSSKLHFQGMHVSGMDKEDVSLYEKGKSLLNDGIQKVRTISHNLHSSILKEFGLNEAVVHFVNLITKDTIHTTIDLDKNYTTQNPENDMSIYRMIQELLNNLLKHAAISKLNINSVYKDSILNIQIDHDGNGLSQQQFEELRYKKEGLGLKNIQNRVILLKGDIEFLKTANENRIEIHIPIKSIL